MSSIGSGFNQTIRPTAFGLYDSSPLFQIDADNIVRFVLTRFGEQVLSVELPKKTIWVAFEEATWQLNGLLAEYQAKSNLASLLGTPTASFNSGANGGNGLFSLNLANTYVQQNLGFLDSLTAPYLSYVGYGNWAEAYTGSIVLTASRQDYDLYSELKDSDGVLLFDYLPSGSNTRFTVHEVYQLEPVEYIFNSNYGSTVTYGSDFTSESGISVPDTKYFVLPLYEDVLRAGLYEDARRIRRSHYSYEQSGRNLRIYPVPGTVETMPSGSRSRLWIKVGFKQPAYDPRLNSDFVASTSSLGSGLTSGKGLGGTYLFPSNIYGVSNPANVPFGVLNYDSLNIWCRNWIREFTLYLCAQSLGWIRTKTNVVPIPGAELTLNGEALLSYGKEGTDKLITSAREYLDGLSYDKLMEKEANKIEQTNRILSLLPYPPKSVITVR
jgi:hypothetical protein